MKKSVRKIIARASAFISGIFFKGLLTILPLAITVAIFNFSLKILVRWLHPLKQFEPTFLVEFPFAEIILALVLIFAIGTIVNFFLLNWIINAFERLIFTIPLVRPIYSGIKQLVHAFNPHDQISFKQVVLVEFPRDGIYSLGFLTSELPSEIAPSESEKFFNVFIPTTPNPTTGYFIMTPYKNIRPVNLNRQEAMAMIISGGIIQPERFVK